MFGVSFRDPNTWYGHSDPVLCAAWVSLASTPWRLATICHLDLHIHRCHDWKIAAKVSRIWNSEKFPGITFIVLFMLNLLIWNKIIWCSDFPTMFALLVLWFGFSMPLVFLGAYFAFRGKPVKIECKPTIFHDTIQSNNSCCPQVFLFCQWHCAF